MFVIKLLVSSDEKIKLEKNAEIKVIHKNCDAEIYITNNQFHFSKALGNSKFHPFGLF